MKACVDGDILAYKCGFSSQKTGYIFVLNNGSKIDLGELTLAQIKKQFVEQNVSPKEGKLQKLIYPEPVAFALQRVRMLIDSILEKSGADEYKIFLTSNDKSNFRFKLATLQEYKGNRKNMKRPVHYDAIREYLMSYYDAEMIYGEEADDAMGIAQMKDPTKSIICTIDKDLDMIPGYHYNIDTQEVYTALDPGTLRLSDDRRKVIGRGLLWFYAQMLLGDSADNIPGIPGYGPVKVVDTFFGLVTENDFAFQVKKAYKEYYKQDWEAAFKEVGNLLWIRRKEGEVKIYEH